MICPTCKGDMIALEYSEIELDYCTDCRGVWFDAGELELLLESAGPDSPQPFLDDVFKSPEANSVEKKRRCPIHGRRMKKVAIGKAGELVVDICQEEDGLWFDGGEVVDLVRQLGGEPLGEQDSQQRVISYLGEVFKAQGWATKDRQR